jgi:hypothetical protein
VAVELLIRAEGSQPKGFNLTGILVQRRSKDVTVLIRGKEPFIYLANRIDSYRLVLDFPGGTSSLSFRELPVDHPMLKRIRIGRHQEKLRLVFDLVRRVRYAIKKSDHSLAVQFRP